MAEISSETRFLHAVEMGLGAWQWGDRMVWQYGQNYGADDVQEAFRVSVNQGIRFVDTAEIYGNGVSERLLGEFMKEIDQPILVATKFFPWPWRFGKSGPLRALRGSLTRLGLESVDLYQIHAPSPWFNIDRLMEWLAVCVQEGLTRTVGVSNYPQTRMVAAYAALSRRNVPLAANQMHYSLLDRTIEKDGTLARCHELGIRLIAYSPLEQGLLTGKYSEDAPPSGARTRIFAKLLPKIDPLLKRLTEIGQDHGGKSNAQVALNWTICKGTLPIPGAKSAEQAQQNSGALGWRLTDDEVANLDELSEQILK